MDMWKHLTKTSAQPAGAWTENFVQGFQLNVYGWILRSLLISFIPVNLERSKEKMLLTCKNFFKENYIQRSLCKFANS